MQASLQQLQTALQNIESTQSKYKKVTNYLSIYLSIYLSLYLPQGSYKLPKVSFEVDAAVFPPGDYHAKGELSFGGKSAGCVELYASFA